MSGSATIDGVTIVLAGNAVAVAPSLVDAANQGPLGVSNAAAALGAAQAAAAVASAAVPTSAITGAAAQIVATPATAAGVAAPLTMTTKHLQPAVGGTDFSAGSVTAAGATSPITLGAAVAGDGTSLGPNSGGLLEVKYAASGFTAAASAAAPVQSVAGRSGAVTLGVKDINGGNYSAGTVLPAGATTARTLGAMAGDVENFYSHGGVDGASDNKAAIDATLAAAASSGRSPWFPAGTINTSGNHTVLAGTSPILAHGTNFSGGGASGDCFIFASGSHTSGHTIGSIGSFQGAAIRLQDAALVGITVDQIGGCGVGVSLNVVSGSVIDNTVSFTTIYSTGIAIEYLSTLTNALWQGNVVRGNFITQCGKAGYFDFPSGDPNCDLNYFWIAAVDGLNGVSTGVNGSGFSASSGGGTPTQTSIIIPGFFGNITGPAILCGNAVYAEVSLQGLFSASQFQAATIGTVIKNIYGRSNFNSPVAAVTAPTDISSFNGGVPLVTMEQAISIALPALAAGATADFYVFHMFTTGYTQMFSAQPRFTQEVVFTAIEDISIFGGVDGNTAPNCVHIRVLAIAATVARTEVFSLRYAGG